MEYHFQTIEYCFVIFNEMPIWLTRSWLVGYRLDPAALVLDNATRCARWWYVPLSQPRARIPNFHFRRNCSNIRKGSLYPKRPKVELRCGYLGPESNVVHEIKRPFNGLASWRLAFNGAVLCIPWPTQGLTALRPWAAMEYTHDVIEYQPTASRTHWIASIYIRIAYAYVGQFSLWN